ncbi:MAG: 50S ribosomal protein L10, partial [Alphaproteobacteria bacterium]|nr:50S ribosomal protein L10 [Alphaproteobacteria bacterium]
EKALAVKEAAVKDLAEKIKKSNIVLLTDYRGITVDQVTELRAELRERIAARIDDSFKKPIEDVVESIKDSKKRRERAKEERKITNSIPTVGRPYE